MSQLNTRTRRGPRGAALVLLVHGVALGIGVPAGRSFGAQQPQQPRTPGGVTVERRVSINFVQADIHDVARALSIQAGVNIVLMPSVKGNVTIRLMDVPLEDALRKTAAAVGVDARKIDNTYFLGSTQELRQMVARAGVKATYPVKNMPAPQVQTLLQNAFPFLTVEVLGQSGLLLLSGTQEDLDAALAMARQADVAVPQPPQPQPQAPQPIKDTYTAKFARPEVLAEALNRVVPGLRVTVVDKTLVMEGLEPVQKEAQKVLAALDVQGATERMVRAYALKYLHPHQASAAIKPFFPNLTVQAGVEPYSPAAATFTPLSTETSQAFTNAQQAGQQQAATGGAAGGVDLNSPGYRSRFIILAGPPSEVEQATQVLQSLDIAPQQVVIEARMVDITPEKAKQLGFLYEWTPLRFNEQNFAGKRPFNFGPFARAPFDWRVTLEALETTRDAKTLAKPNIAVIDGEQASIFIGDILRFERLSSVTEGGQQVFTIEAVPVGVALLCRPRVNDEGRITLRVHPVVSSVTGFVGRNNDIPITASREAESTVLMQDGETIAIGGLLRDEELRVLNKVPILGDIPFIGEIFRHRRETKRRSEVTVFLTARILKDGDTTSAVNPAESGTKTAALPAAKTVTIPATKTR